jgi:hypothetical protein
MNTSVISYPNKLETKFFKFLENNKTVLTSETDVKDFMVANFKKPDSLSPATKNNTDKGVLFLKDLERRNLIDFDDEALNHVNVWTHFVNGIEHKRWFDTLHEPLWVTIVPYFKPPHFNENIRTKLINHRTVSQKLKSYTEITWLAKGLKKLSIKNIGEMIIAGAIIALLIWYFKFNAVRI